MVTIKAYTDTEQSKVLSKILPPESADMGYNGVEYRDVRKIRYDNVATTMPNMDSIPCWSLAALLAVLHYPQLSKDKLGSGKAGWMVSAYPNDCRYDSCWHDNPVDACYEMILKLNELKML